MDLEFARLKEVLNTFGKQIEPVIEELLLEHVDPDHCELLRYPVFTGGKRLRPSLTIMSCLACGGSVEPALFPAAGIEIIHNYTLVVDDMIDDSDTRRGHPTTWKTYGNSIANCIAVDFGAAAFSAASRSEYQGEVLETYSKTIKKIMDGEILDILFEHEGRDDPFVVKNRYHDIDEADYFRMIRLKTSTLFEVSCKLGAICASANHRQLEALGTYGSNIGMAFQISDDILDIFVESDSGDYCVSKDLLGRKLGNIVVILALQKLDAAGRDRLLQFMKDGRNDDREARDIVHLISETGAKQQALERGEAFVEKATKALSCIPEQEWTSLLSDLAYYLLKRES